MTEEYTGGCFVHKGTNEGNKVVGRAVRHGAPGAEFHVHRISSTALGPPPECSSVSGCQFVFGTPDRGKSAQSTAPRALPDRSSQLASLFPQPPADEEASTTVRRRVDRMQKRKQRIQPLFTKATKTTSKLTCNLEMA